MPRPKPGKPIDSHIPEQPWYEGARCLSPFRGLSGYDLTSLFYSEEPEDIAAAKSVCAECDIRALCLETSLAFKEPDGVWGGLTEPERRSVMRKRRRGAA